MTTATVAEQLQEGFEKKDEVVEEKPKAVTWDLPSTDEQEPMTGIIPGESWLLYGPPKVGKSTFAAGFPTPLIIDLEDGYRRIKCATPLKPNTLNEFRECFGMIRTRISEDKFPFETIVVDSLDVLNSWFEQEACRELGIKQMGEGSWGSDWATARDKLLKVIDAFRALRKTIVLIGHSKMAIVEQDSMRAKTCDLPGKLARFLTAKVENIGYCYGLKDKEGIKRVVSFEPYEELDAGCRNRALAGKIIPMSYKNLKEVANAESKS